VSPRFIYYSQAAFNSVLQSESSREEKNALFADMCRINVLYMVAKAGSGHLGSSFSSLDIVSWIFLNELRLGSALRGFPYRDVYFSSKGHDSPGLYAVLIALGHLGDEYLQKLRRFGGLPGHPDVNMTGCVTNTGSLGMGISKAKGMAAAARLDGDERRFWVMTGDGELQEGQIWESLLGAANAGMGEITVIVDHNKLQSDVWVAQTSDLGDIEAKFKAFGWRTCRVDGHNASALSRAFAGTGCAGERPLAVIADTVKGQGVSFMEHSVPMEDRSPYRYHSGAPSPWDYGRAVEAIMSSIAREAATMGLATPTPEDDGEYLPAASLDDVQRFVPAYSSCLVEAAEQNETMIVLDADLKMDCGLIPFEERFPQRFFECGIAEQDMVSTAGGFALAGKLPICHSFSCFLSTRANEQIYNNATEGTKIIYTGFLSGVVPAPPGHSHQSVRDISALGAVPGLVLFEPCCVEELRLAVRCFTDQAWTQSVWLRMTSIPCQVPFALPKGYVLREGCGCIVRNGDDIGVLTYGPVMLAEAVKAAETLQNKRLSVRVINMPWLNRLDPDWLARNLKGLGGILVVDNHYLSHGVGEMVASSIARMRLSISIERMGLKDVPPCGQNAEVLAALALDTGAMCKQLVRMS